MQNFSEILLSHYTNTPDKVCVQLLQTNQPDQPITYQDLLEGSAGYVKTYQNKGILPGEVVILILQHGIELLYAYFGAILHGAIPSIMPYLTEKLLPERYQADLSALILITNPAGIITYRDFLEVVKSSIGDVKSVKCVIDTGDAEKPQKVNTKLISGLKRKPDDIVLLQHSSGSTGLQKGVALSHQAVINQLESYRKAIDLDGNKDVIISWLPLYHDMGLIACFLLPILLNIPLVLLSPFDWVKAPYRLLQAVTRYKGTITWLPNFAYNFCAQKIRDRSLENVDLSSWRAIINCSEPMRWESHQLFFDRFKEYGLKFEALATCYAMAENVFAVTQGGIQNPVFVDMIDRDVLMIQGLAEKTVDGRAFIRMLSAGRLIDGVELKILDKGGRPVGDRKVGEIAIKSNCMLNEYYHRPDATKKAFQDGWYLTGDFGYTVSGEVFVTGRKKDLIIVGGKNVYPQDIEQLAMEVPEVHAGRVVAFGMFNDEIGTEDVVVIAEVDDKYLLEKEAIEDKIRMVVTRGSAIALKEIHLVDRKWLIKTSSGKVARSANREKFLKEFRLQYQSI